MFSLESLCKSYVEKKYVLDVDLIASISRDLLGGDYDIIENFDYLLVLPENFKTNLDYDIILTINKKNIRTEVASIPLYYYIAAVYENWTVDNIQLALKEVLTNIKSIYRNTIFLDYFIEDPFLETIIMFNNNLSDDVKLWLKIR
jgi:hypothetical protein